MRLTRWFAGLALAVATCRAPVAQEAPLGVLKSAYLLNFAMLVTWPDESKDVLQLCIADAAMDAADAASLENLDGRSVRHMKLSLRHGLKPADQAGCDMIYLPVAENGLIEKLRARLGHHALLIVGAGETAAARGAGIGMFVAADGRLAFDLNLGALSASRLKFNTRLLPLARRVYP